MQNVPIHTREPAFCLVFVFVRYSGLTIPKGSPAHADLRIFHLVVVSRVLRIEPSSANGGRRRPQHAGPCLRSASHGAGRPCRRRHDGTESGGFRFPVPRPCRVFLLCGACDLPERKRLSPGHRRPVRSPRHANDAVQPDSHHRFCDAGKKAERGSAFRGDGRCGRAERFFFPKPSPTACGW